MSFYALLRLSHDLQTFLNVHNALFHLFSGMYTSQGSDDILVRMMWTSWETFVVHQRTFDAFSNKWNHLHPMSSLHAFWTASHTTCRTFLNVLMHVDLFSGCTRLAKGIMHWYTCAQMCGKLGRISLYIRACLGATLTASEYSAYKPFYAFC